MGLADSMKINMTICNKFDQAVTIPKGTINYTENFAGLQWKVILNSLRIFNASSLRIFKEASVNSVTEK